MNILFQSDNNYAPYMGVAIFSLLENNKSADRIVIYVIDDGIDSNNIDKLNRTVSAYGREIKYISAEELLCDEKCKDAFSYAGFRKNKHSYLKLFVGDYLTNLHGKMLYVDCDTVIEGDLNPLFSFDLNGNTIGMVRDSLMGESRTSIGINANDEYFNSGVILFDLDTWRNRDCFRRIIDHLRNVRTYGTVDQDVLNVVLKNEICTLPITYNLQSIHMVATVNQFFKVCQHKEPFYTKQEIEEAMNKPTIVHFLRFLGEHPWNLDTLHPDKVFFDKYAYESEWKDDSRKRETFSFAQKIERQIYLHANRVVFLKLFFYFHERMVAKSNIHVTECDALK